MTGSRSVSVPMRQDLKGLDILIVAGGQLSTIDLADSLEKRGAHAIIAPNCPAAFEALRRGRPDAAVLDFGLGEACTNLCIELNVLDVPRLYVGAPQKGTHHSVRTLTASSVADAILMLVQEFDEPIATISPDVLVANEKAPTAVRPRGTL